MIGEMPRRQPPALRGAATEPANIDPRLLSPSRSTQVYSSGETTGTQVASSAALASSPKTVTRSVTPKRLLQAGEPPSYEETEDMTPRPAGTTVPPATQDPVPCYNKIKPLAQKRSWTAVVNKVTPKIGPERGNLVWWFNLCRGKNVMALEPLRGPEGKPLQDRVLMESTWDKIVEEFGSDNDAWLKVWLADPSEE